MSKQLALPLSFFAPPAATFSSYFAGKNKKLVEKLKLLPSKNNESIFLYGEKQVGKSHLLLSLCALYNEQNKTAQYLKLSSEIKDLVSMFQGLENLNAVFLDDINHVIGNEFREGALLNLLNRLEKSSTNLVLTSDQPILHLNYKLDKLKYLLLKFDQVNVCPLNLKQRSEFFQSFALMRGLSLKDSIVEYISKRFDSVQKLYNILLILDEEALSANNKITLQFVKNILEKQDLY